MSSYEELLAEYKKLAVKADVRLGRLEQLAASEAKHYGGVLTYAYSRAMRDIRSWSGPEAKRFYAKAPKSAQQLQAKINDIKTFLNAPTSAKRGITNIYKERANTVNKKYGTNFTWEDLANYYESDLASQLDQEYGSDTLIRALGSIKRIANNPDKIKEAIECKLKLAGDDIINEKAVELLNKYGMSLSQLFK